MKLISRLALVMALLSMASVAFAQPGKFKLFSPKSIAVDSRKMTLKLQLELPCAEDYPLDWASDVLSNDDSGDLVKVVAVALPMDFCNPGPLKTYERTINLREHGFKRKASLRYVTFEPATLAE